MHQRLWNERMAEALREREESTEELLRKFEIFMERHGYEKKILASLQGCFFWVWPRDQISKRTQLQGENVLLK